MIVAPAWATSFEIESCLALRSARMAAFWAAESFVPCCRAFASATATGLPDILRTTETGLSLIDAGTNFVPEPSLRPMVAGSIRSKREVGTALSPSPAFATAATASATSASAAYVAVRRRRRPLPFTGTCTDSLPLSCCRDGLTSRLPLPKKSCHGLLACGGVHTAPWRRERQVTNQALSGAYPRAGKAAGRLLRGVEVVPLAVPAIVVTEP